MNEPWEASHVPTFGLNPTPVEPNKLVDTQSCLQPKLRTGFFVGGTHCLEKISCPIMRQALSLFSANRLQFPLKSEEMPLKCLARELQVKVGTLGGIPRSLVWSPCDFPHTRQLVR